MKKEIKNLINKGLAFEHKNRVEILAGIGVVGVWVTAYKFYKAGPQAAKILEAHQWDMERVHPDDKEAVWAVRKETAKQLVPVLGPPFIFAAVTSACIFGSAKTANHRLGVLSAAYVFKDTRLRELESKTKEVLGDSKAQKVREAIQKDHVEAAGVPDETRIIHTGLGEDLCYDEYTDRYFYCSAKAIEEAVIHLSHRIQSEMWISLNEYYQEIKLRPCGLGEDLGFHIDHTDEGMIPLYKTAILVGDRPCLSVGFDVDVLKRPTTLY